MPQPGDQVDIVAREPDLAPEEVLILEPHRQALVAVRSLGHAGCRVVVGRSAEPAFPTLSRHVDEVWVHPDMQAEPARFLEALRTFLQTRTGARRPIVHCAGEVSLELLAREADSFAGLADLAIPPPQAALRCLDKARMHELVAGLGIPQPATELYAGPDAWEQLAARVGYPCVLKGRDSFKHRVRDRKAIFCTGPEALRAALSGLTVAQQEAMLVQSFVPGRRHNCHFAAFEGRLIAFFEQEVLRTDRADGSGYGVEGVSVAPSSRLRDWCARIVEALGYHGIGCVQFLVADDGSASFLELNPRLDATTALPHACGIDLARLAIECVVRTRDGLGPPSAPTRYPVGEYNYWLFGDVVSWLNAVKQGQDGPVDHRARLEGILRALARRPHHLNWSWRDPVPALYLYATTFPPMLWRRLRAAVARVPGSSAELPAEAPGGPGGPLLRSA
jgi:predicted ATP-grasp superfamily ATP-dependent carboligase